MADQIRYETKFVQSVRGLEARTRTKWEKEGWEFIQQDSSSPLSSRLTFRRPKKPTPRAFWIAVAALLVIGIGGLAIVGVLPHHGKPAAESTHMSSTPAKNPAHTSTMTPTPSAAANTGPSDAEVLAAFDRFFAERKTAGVMVGKAVTDVTYSGRVVTVTFDPAAAGVSPETFDQLNAFPNLATFAASPIAFNDQIGNRVRPVVDSIATVRSDGKALGTLSHAEILALNGLSQ